MSKVKQVTLALCGLSAILLLTSCWEGDSKRLENAFERAEYGTTAIALTVSDDATLIEVGQQVSFVVTATDREDAQRVIPSSKIDWSLSCSQPGCAFLSDKGVLIGKGNGIATVTATYDTLTATAEVEVSSAKLDRIEVVEKTPGGTIDFCRPIQIEAYGYYDDGKAPRNITHLASWSSETPAATVYQDDAGLVFFSTTTAEAVGISATHASFESEAKTGTGMFTANGTLPNSGAFSPAGFSTVFTGQTKQYTLTGTWDDGSDGITHNVSWNSVDSTVAAFTGNTTSSTLSSRQDGLLTGVSASTEGTQISALCGAEVLGEPQTVIVRELVIEGIKIYKEGDPIAKDAYDITLGRTDTFRAEAVYAGGDVDGAALDITQDCYWESEEPNANAIQVGNAELVSNPTTEQKKGSIKGVSLTENMTPDNYAGLRVTLKSCRGQSDCESTVVQIRVKQ